MKTLTLPPKTKQLLDHYFNLDIAGKKIVCPYYQNIWKTRKTPVLAGKGLPNEIEKWAKKLIKIKPVLKKLPITDLRFRLTLAGLGADCSGLATNLLSQFLKEKHDISLQKFAISKDLPLFLGVRILIRPRANFSANLLTTPPLARPIKINQTHPGDLIKFDIYHLALISKVWKTKKNVEKLEYVHSTSNYADKYGVRTGKIEIIHPNKGLEHQKWTETYQGKNWTKEDYLNSPPDKRGLRSINI